MTKKHSFQEDSKPQKIRVKKLTRAQAEKALSHGADPMDELFTKHPNYHVRRKAWQLSGRQLPEKVEDQNKFLATLQGKEVPKDTAAQPAFFEELRQRILKEKPEPIQLDDRNDPPAVTESQNG